jgi:L-seryl-tRNA(Ser) seleniumtransferase
MAAASGLPHPVCVELARAAIADGPDAYAESAACERAVHFHRTLLTPVVNATGVLLHTNLGRAPVAFTTRPGGERRVRPGHRRARLAPAGRRAAVRPLCGAEAAMIVNNNAAAVLLVTAALAAGRRCWSAAARASRSAAASACPR